MNQKMWSHFIYQHYLTDSGGYHVFVSDSTKDVVSQKLLQEVQTEYCTYEHKARKIFFSILQKDKTVLRKQQKELVQNHKPHSDSSYDNRKNHFLSQSFLCLCEKNLLTGSHAGKEEFLALGIRGVEFGLWMSNADAQAALDQCYYALPQQLDLCSGYCTRGYFLWRQLGPVFWNAWSRRSTGRL